MTKQLQARIIRGCTAKDNLIVVAVALPLMEDLPMLLYHGADKAKADELQKRLDEALRAMNLKVI